jgi:hypothetical protein
MARDQDVRNTRLFDRRTVDRNIKKGLLTRKDFEKHLKALEDVADKGVYGGGEAEEAATETEPAAPTNNQGH